MTPRIWNWIAAGIILCGIICLPCAAAVSHHAQYDARRSGIVSNETHDDGMGPGSGMAPPDATNWTPRDGMKGNGTPHDGMKPNCTPSDGMKFNGTPPDGMKPNCTPSDGMKFNGTPDEGMMPNCTPHDGMKGNGTLPDGVKPNGTDPDGMLSGNRSEHRGFLSGVTGFMTDFLH
jgi:hypothetical protein